MRTLIKIQAFMLAAAMMTSSMVLAVDKSLDDAVSYCMQNKIICGDENGDLLLQNNLTREQTAKILVEAFDIESGESMPFDDISENRWSYMYISSFKKCMKKIQKNFNPTEDVSREEFIASIVLAAGFKESDLKDSNILSCNFEDENQIDVDYYDLVGVAVEKGYIIGSDKKIRPKDKLTRGEACLTLHRILEGINANINTELDTNIESDTVKTETFLMDKPKVTLEKAKEWAQSRGAAQRYIDVADIYWKYGELTGIRPDLLYAQAAKETGFGKYGGQVKPEQNNWAGIRGIKEVFDSSNFATFATPEDGVRAHFNHVCAYIGLEPIGEPHERYYVVKKMEWAGTVKTLEELGDKWCPTPPGYADSVLHNYLEEMERF